MKLIFDGLRQLAVASFAFVFYALLSVLLATAQATASGSVTMASSLPKAAVGRDYNESTVPFYDPMSYTTSFSLTSGTLPPGLTLGTTGWGQITGTPTETGSWTFTVSVVDTKMPNPGTPNSATLTIVVGTPVSLTTTSIPAGTVGVPYSYQLEASGGDKPYSFSLSLGNLPAGLTLSSDGLISGTPTTVQTVNGIYAVSDANYSGAGDSTRGYWIEAQTLPVSVVAAVAPTVTGVSPDHGSTAGGTSVTITGTGFTGVSAVSFGGLAATNFTVDSATQITAVTPEHDAGAADVKVTTGGGSDTKAGAFTFESPAPGVTDVSPDHGPAAGGTSVTITGTDFSGATAVSFGGTPANFDVDSATKITAVAPAHAAGTVDVKVTTPGGSDNAVAAFTYEAPASTDAALSGFSVSAGTLDPQFSPDVFAYSLDVDYGVDAIAVTPTLSDKNATVRVNGVLVPSGAASLPIPLGPGAEQISVTVTAEDGTTTQTYVLTINSGRPDPASDPDVVGLINAQESAARRFAGVQMQNFNRRLEQLHHLSAGSGSGTGSGGAAAGSAESQGNQMVGGGRDATGGDEPQALANAAGGTSSLPSLQSDFGSLGAWAGGFVNLGESDGGGLDLDNTTVGVSGGVDHRFSDQFAAGFGIGFGRDRTKIGSDGTENLARAYSAAVYGSYAPTDGFYIDGVLGGSVLDNDSTRFIAANGEFASGSRSGTQIFGSITAAYEYSDGAFLLSPYGRVEFSRSWLDEFTELGGAGYALSYGDEMVDTLSGALGVRASYALDMEWGTLVPGIRVEYAGEAQDGSEATVGYADMGDPADIIDVDRYTYHRATLGLSLDFQFEDDVTLSLDYSASLGNGSRDSTLGASVGWRF